MTLTDIQIRNAKPKSKAYRLWDEKSLYLEVSPKGNKWWRFKYRFEGKEKRISLGVYPDVGLKDARNKRDQEIRLLRVSKVDPSAQRKAVSQSVVEKQANSFETITREWYNKHIAHQMAETHRQKILRNFERDVFPWIGKKPIADIEAPLILEVLNRVEKRGAFETAHRTLNNCSRVFSYAIATARAKYDPCPPLRRSLSPVKRTHRAAITDPKKLAGLLRAIDAYEGTLVVQCALKLAPLLFLRPKELRTMEWKDIDDEENLLNFLSTKKHKKAMTPLAKQSMQILMELYPLTGTGRYVFPSFRSSERPMSDNAVLSALRRMGIPKDETCGHGFRATARTILAERLGVRREIIEMQLTHDVLDSDGRAYNRAEFLDERKEMMQKWADYLDDLKLNTPN